MEDALISPMGLAVLSGAGLIEANSDHKSCIHRTKDVLFKNGQAVIQGNSAFKPLAPTVAKNIYVMAKDSYGELNGVTFQYDGQTAGADKGSATVEGNNLTIILPAKIDGEPNPYLNGFALVDYYVLCETKDVTTVEITPNNFGGYFYVEASCLYRQEKDGRDFPAELVIPKIKVQSNFTFNMSSSGDPSTFTFTCDAFPAYVDITGEQKKVLADIQIIDDTIETADIVEQSWIDADIPAGE